MFEKLALIIQREISATLRRPFFLIFALGAPIVLAIVGLVIFQINKSNPLPAEGSEQAAAQSGLAEGLLDPAGIIPPEAAAAANLRPYPDEGAARAALEAGEISAYYQVPLDYVQSGKVDYYTLEANPLLLNVNNYGLGRLLAYGLLAADPALAERALTPLDLKVTSLAEAASLEEENWFVIRLPMFMVILLYMVILVPASNLVGSLTDEKKNQVLEVLLCSVSPMQLFVGKLLATGLLGLLQTLLWVGLVWGIGSLGGQPLEIPAGYSVPLPLLFWCVIFALLGYMMYGTQMAGVGALAPDMNESRSVTLLILLPLIVGYSLAGVTEEQPFGLLAYFLSYFPLTAPVGMISRMAAADLPLWEPLLSTALQVLAVLWLVRTFGKLFQARLMLSGQSLSVKRLFAALRE